MNTVLGHAVCAGQLLDRYFEHSHSMDSEYSRAETKLAKQIYTTLHRRGLGISAKLLQLLKAEACEIEQLCIYVEEGRLQLKSIKKVLGNIQAGNESQATEEARILRDKGYGTLRTWLNGLSLQRLEPKEQVIYSGTIFDQPTGRSVSTMRGGLPGLGRKK